jgi:hypothetical protein
MTSRTPKIKAISRMEDFRALDPFFRIIEQGLRNYTDGEHFFDLLADDVVFDFVITVPGYPRHVVGRDTLVELFRGYGQSFFLDSCDDLRVHHDPETSTAVPLTGARRRISRRGRDGRPSRPGCAEERRRTR